MQWPAHDSPFWMLARQVASQLIMAIICFGFFLFAYKNHMEQKDIVFWFTLVTGVGGSVFGVDMLKTFKASPPTGYIKEENKE